MSSASMSTLDRKSFPSTPWAPSHPRRARAPLYPRARSSAVPVVMRTPPTPQSHRRGRTGISPALVQMSMASRSLSPTEDADIVRVRSSGPQRHAAHRRAHWLSSLSYGYMLFPPTPAARAPSPLFRTPSPSFASSPTFAPAAHPTSSASTPAPSLPHASKLREPRARLVLVAAPIAAHLQRGGSVSVSTIDGERRWRARVAPVVAQAAFEGADGGGAAAMLHTAS
ncbi:hypothetical protein Q5752_002833 [Cryptotrichosporon argae]